MSKKIKVGVLSYSGGQDSTTVLCYAKNLGYELYALSFMYGQSLSREIEQAKKICEILGVKHKIINVEGFKDLAWFSALTHPERYPLLKYEKYEDIGQQIFYTYVPMRNSFFLVCCMAYLESILLREIEEKKEKPEDIEGRIFIASTFGSNYPDNKPNFLKIAEDFLNEGSKLWTYYNVRVKIEAPLISMSKKEITEFGVKLKAPLHLTQTCYENKEEACGKCSSCLLRIKGFKEAGYIDPIKYRVKIDWSNCKKIDYLEDVYED